MGIKFLYQPQTRYNKIFGDGYEIIVPLPLLILRSRVWIVGNCLPRCKLKALLGKRFNPIDELENCVNMQKDSDRLESHHRDRCPVHPYSRLNTMLAIFEFNGQQVRWINGKPVANDVAKVLGYKDPSDAVYRLVKPNNKGVCKSQTPGGIQELTVLEEAGIYQLIFGSKLPAAERFQDWVFSVVLPTIRATGMYCLNNNATLDDDKILNQIDKVASVLNNHCGDEYRQKFTIDNLQNTYPHLSFPNQKKRKPRRNSDEVILSKIYNKAQVIGRITPRQVQQWFTNRHNKVTADNARAYLRKLCELGLGYLETDGTFVAHIDNEIMAQLAI